MKKIKEKIFFESVSRMVFNEDGLTKVVSRILFSEGGLTKMVQ